MLENDFFSQGRLIETRHTARWSQEEKNDAELSERCRVFYGFTVKDEGRSRVYIGQCHTPEAAKELVRELNKTYKLLKMFAGL